jgi:hypothetical protein|tara:strand:+ start:354 stop:650 length:297 start_codon:yes stop_codon:yes gene_type:complete
MVLWRLEMNRNECLKIAQDLINGDRASDYGDAYLNHARVAALWTTYTQSRTTALSPVDVAMMMVLMKVARTMENPKNDSFVDIAGYAALASEMAMSNV